MNLNLNDEQLRTVISGAIMQLVTPEKREELMREALQYLLRPVVSDYGRSGPPPIQQAFERAAVDLAREVMAEQFKEDSQFRAAVDSIIADAAKKVLIIDRDETVTAVACAIASGLSRRGN